MLRAAAFPCCNGRGSERWQVLSGQQDSLSHACPTRRLRCANEQMLGDGLGAKSDAGVLGWEPALPPSSRAVGEVSRKAGDCLTSSSVRLNVLSSSGRAAGAKCVVPTGFMLWDEELPVCSLCFSFLPQLEESLVHCSKAEVGTCCLCAADAAIECGLFSDTCVSGTRQK